MKSTEWKNHTLLAASLAIVLMAIGCGREESHASAGATSTEKGVTRVAESQTGGPRGEAVGAIATADAGRPEDGATNGGPAAETSKLEGNTAPQADSEPPDVVASIADSLATPGMAAARASRGRLRSP